MQHDVICGHPFNIIFSIMFTISTAIQIAVLSSPNSKKTPNTGGGFSLNHSTSKFGSQMRHWNIFITFSFVEFSKTEWNIEILWILFALRRFFGIFLDHDSFEFFKNDTEISFIDDITSWLKKVFFDFILVRISMKSQQDTNFILIQITYETFSK